MGTKNINENKKSIEISNRKNRKIITVGGILLLLCIIAFATVLTIQNLKTRKLEPKKLENSLKISNSNKIEEKLEGEAQEKITNTAPVEVKRYGWKPIYKTVPTPGYIWEWAVELENKTPLALNIYIKYNLINEEGLIVGEGKGGKLLEGKRVQTIIGQAVAPEEITQTRKVKIEISVSPSRANETEDIEKSWYWPDPYIITIQ